ncbi:MAG: hypothetical protein PHQ59_02475 [Candidatus Daviesbacteria bacterium]|nr:hypothetical protein [Candidatus Daviesbacteria bacterium]
MNILKFIKKIDLSWLFLITTPIFVIALFWFRFTPSVEFIIFFIATCFYLTLALIHHFYQKTLILEIVIEYILISVLALIIIQSLIL